MVAKPEIDKLKEIIKYTEKAEGLKTKNSSNGAIEWRAKDARQEGMDVVQK